MPHATPRDPVSCVLPVRNLGDRAGPYVAKWVDGLAKLGRDFQLLVVDDGSTDGTADAVEASAARTPQSQLHRHQTPRGVGACLRTALPHAIHPLLLYATADYPYEPADVRKMLEVFGKADEYTGMCVRVVNGCRAGRPKPAFWALAGRMNRAFRRVILGNPIDPFPGWLGACNHAYSWFAWLVFGDPFTDPNSGFKLFDRALIDRFPIQSDGDFVHTELVAKATFLTTLVSEVPLSPKPDPVPQCRFGRDLWAVYARPKFTHPEPEAAPPVEEVPHATPAPA